MKIILGNHKYTDGTGHPIFDKDYDFLLYRQDFFGNESVYFNENEIDEVGEKIDMGEILIHMNYSLLVTRTEELKKKYDNIFGCYTIVTDGE